MIREFSLSDVDRLIMTILKKSKRYSPLGNGWKIGDCMSVDGYFESIIDTWRTVKRTPSLVRDMKEVIRQFNTSYNNDEISNEMKQYLKAEFDKIYREVYN